MGAILKDLASLIESGEQWMRLGTHATQTVRRFANEVAATCNSELQMIRHTGDLQGIFCIIGVAYCVLALARNKLFQRQRKGSTAKKRLRKLFGSLVSMGMTLGFLHTMTYLEGSKMGMGQAFDVIFYQQIAGIVRQIVKEILPKPTFGNESLVSFVDALALGAILNYALQWSSRAQMVWYVTSMLCQLSFLVLGNLMDLLHCSRWMKTCVCVGITCYCRFALKDPTLFLITFYTAWVSVISLVQAHTKKTGNMILLGVVTVLGVLPFAFMYLFAMVSLYVETKKQIRRLPYNREFKLIKRIVGIQVEKDAYAILGVAENASIKDVKKAFREQSKSVHPDKNPSPAARVQFERLQTAYQQLVERGASDKESREQMRYEKNLPILLGINQMTMMVATRSFELALVLLGCGAQIALMWRHKKKGLYEFKSTYHSFEFSVIGTYVVHAENYVKHSSSKDDIKVYVTPFLHAMKRLLAHMRISSRTTELSEDGLKATLHGLQAPIHAFHKNGGYDRGKGQSFKEQFKRSAREAREARQQRNRQRSGGMQEREQGAPSDAAAANGAAGDAAPADAAAAGEGEGSPSSRAFTALEKDVCYMQEILILHKLQHLLQMRLLATIYLEEYGKKEDRDALDGALKGLNDSIDKGCQEMDAFLKASDAPITFNPAEFMAGQENDESKRNVRRKFRPKLRQKHDKALAWVQGVVASSWFDFEIDYLDGTKTLVIEELSKMIDQLYDVQMT